MGSSGKTGEDYAAKMYERAGFIILERNYHSRFGEIDIIATDGEYLVFSEVKTRMTGGLTHPAESVTKSKQSKIMKTAQIYLMRMPSELQPRFDVVSVRMSKGTVEEIELIENAF